MSAFRRVAAIHLAAILALALPLISFVGPARAADVFDTVAASDNLTVLKRALDLGDMIDTLKSKGPFTLFAPTDEAFADLPAGAVDFLLKPESKDLLRSLMRYHVLPGKTLKAARILEVGNFDINTLHGDTAEIDIKNGLMIENARIMQVDLAVDNGVIHMIDKVMLPPDVKTAFSQPR